MNIYGVIAFVVAIIVFAHVFHAVEPISQFIATITNIPELDYSRNGPLYKLAVRLGYLIVFVAVVKMILMRKNNNG